MFDLTGKIALAPGGAGYLGVPTCQGLAAQGATLLLADMDERKVAQAVTTIKTALPAARVEGLVMNVGDESSILRAIEQVRATHGRLDILVNLAATAIGKYVEELSAAEFEAANRVNQTGAFLLARAAADLMPTGGSMIFFSSMYGQVAPDPALYVPPMKPNPIEYGMAKAAILQMTRYLAVHWGKRGIRVNAIAPGPFPHFGFQAGEPEFMQRLAAKTPLGRIGQGADIAGAAVFLASDEAAYITGQTLEVNGGWTIW